MRILVVEDDRPLADTIVRGLQRDGFAVDVVHDGESALDRARVVEYDAVVLDRDLPLMHGDEVCRRLGADQSMTRVLMLTASSTVDQRVDGLMLGADDYMTKPFAIVELAARLRALGRRANRPRPPRIEWRDLWMEPARRTAGRGDRDLALTNREYAVLEELMCEPGALVSAEQLMERVWDDRLDPFSNAVRVTMLTLRRKLGDPPIIATVPRAGYRLESS